MKVLYEGSGIMSIPYYLFSRGLSEDDIRQTMVKTYFSKETEIVVAISQATTMKNDYAQGKVQDLLEKLLSLALALSSTLKVYSFNRQVYEHPPITLRNYKGYVKRHIECNGGTKYSPVIKTIRESYAKKNCLILFITDSVCYDPKDSLNMFSLIAKENAFWQFIGISREDFRVLKKAKDEYENINFLELPLIYQLPEVNLYEKILTPYKAYLAKKCKEFWVENGF